MAKKTASKYADYPDAIIGQAMTFKGKAWIGGSGSFPSDYMFVGEKPGQGEARTKAVFTGPGGQRLLHRLEKFGFDMRSVYYTNAVKYALPPGKSAKISDITACSKVLAHEIEECKPKVIICLGAQALKAVSGAKVGISVCRGEFRDHPDYDAKIFAMHSPAYTLRSEEVLPAFEKDIKTLVAYQNGTYSHKYVPQFALVKRALQPHWFLMMRCTFRYEVDTDEYKHQRCDGT